MTNLEHYCIEYAKHVKDMTDFKRKMGIEGYSIYGMETIREDLHWQIIKYAGLNDFSDTWKYTNGMDRINYSGNKLYLLVLETMKKRSLIDLSGEYKK
jgi:hypothetical protein